MSNTRFMISEDKTVLTAERSFAAPLSKVWAAYTTPELFAKWWGPTGWETVVPHMDVTPGGYLLYGMQCKDPGQAEWYGKTSWGKSVYETIKPEEELRYSDYFCDENGEPTPGMPVTEVTLHMTERDGLTTVVSSSKYASAEALAQVIEMGVEAGFDQTLDRLDDLLTAK